jgi:hypothetical protein
MLLAPVHCESFLATAPTSSTDLEQPLPRLHSLTQSGPESPRAVHAAGARSLRIVLRNRTHQLD